MLELTLSVAISTISILEMVHLTSGDLHRLDLIYQVFGFSTVCSDILDSTGTALTRDYREVFCTIELMSNTVVYKVIPYVSRSTTYPLVIETLDKRDARMDYGTLVITCE